METNNVTLKKKMRKHRVRQWQIAEYLGIHETELSRRFRHPLSEDFAKEVEDAIEILATQNDEK